MFLTKEDLGEDLCSYCSITDYGREKGYYADSTGYHFCEGSYCDEAYENYLETAEEE